MITAVANQNNNLLTQKANELVNMVFWGSLMREFRQANPPTLFDGGSSSAAFVRHLDLELIKRISKRGSTPMADAIVSRLDQDGKYRLNTAQQKAAHQLAGSNRGINP